MRINIFAILFLSVMMLFTACKNSEETEDVSKIKTEADKEEFEGLEVLFDDSEFSDPRAVELLKEINICSDNQLDEHGKLVTPCSPENFKFFPLKEGTSISDGFVLLIKANTGGFSLRRILVFERENGALVKVNGFIANLIGMKKKDGTNDDLLLRFIDKIEDSDVYYHCVFSWKEGKYAFKSVEVIQEPAGNFSGIVKESVKDSVSQDIYKILIDNQMIF